VEIRNITGGFLFRSEKVAVFEAAAEWQAGPDQKCRDIYFFCARGDQYRLVL
jgi:hypothetical protein